MHVYNRFLEEITTLKDIHQSLVMLEAYQRFPKIGICGHVAYDLTGSTSDKITKIICDMAEEWPEWSGDYVYPVPSFNSRLSPADVFRETPNVWSGAYGAARLRLLDFLIDKTKLEHESRK